MNYNCVDNYLRDCWNNISSEKVYSENFWNYCRLLESKNILNSDKGAVSTLAIGPFKIALDLEFTRKDILLFYFEIIIPAIIAKCVNNTFEDAYNLFILPSAQVLIKILDGTFIIKEEILWNILIYIQQQNNENFYPKEIDISNHFLDLDIFQIRSALHKLECIKNTLGEVKSIIKKDAEGRYKSLV